MHYKELAGETVSYLGMGNMRLPTTGKDRFSSPIHRAKAQEIIDYAYAHGVNYYDTAYVYHNGESETFLGEALKKYPRESYFLATKFPGFILKPGQTPEGIFEEQLRRCQTEYFDFYLIHNLNEETENLYMDEAVGIVRYFEEQKKAGRIRHLGFSSHGKPETLERFASWRSWDFAQLQINYLDWTLQDAKRQYDILTERGIPVIVMEPVRGGRLASLTPELDEVLKQARPERSVASWAFRWLMGLDNVKLILSGMTELPQLADNVATFERYEPLTQEENTILMEVCDRFRKQFHVPCTACRYCCGDCPQELDIPRFMNAYNEVIIAEFPMILMEIRELAQAEQPSSCIACGACVAHCPQSIDIPGVMQKLSKAVAGAKGFAPPEEPGE